MSPFRCPPVRRPYTRPALVAVTPVHPCQRPRRGGRWDIDGCIGGDWNGLSALRNAIASAFGQPTGWLARLWKS